MKVISKLYKIINIVIIVILCLLIVKVLYLKGIHYTEVFYDWFDHDINKQRIYSSNRIHGLEDLREPIINKYMNDILKLISACKIEEAFQRYEELLRLYYIKDINRLNMYMDNLTRRLIQIHPYLFYMYKSIYVSHIINTTFPTLIKNSIFIFIGLHLHHILVMLIILKVLVWIVLVSKDEIKIKK